MVLEGLKNSSGCTSPLNFFAFGANPPEGKGAEGGYPSTDDFYNFSIK